MAGNLFEDSLRWPKRVFLNRFAIEIQLIDDRAYNLRARFPTREWETFQISVDMWEALEKQFNSFPPRNGWPAEKFPVLKELLEKVLEFPEVILIHPKKQRRWVWEEHPNIICSIIAVLHTKLK